ncbi:hypothetical protein J7L48_07905, partial [bacterium]|nr:hypothetical protein [bacterium]
MKNKLFLFLVIFSFISFGCNHYVKVKENSKDFLFKHLEYLKTQNIEGKIFSTKKGMLGGMNFLWKGKNMTFIVYHPITGKSFKFNLESKNNIKLPYELDGVLQNIFNKRKYRINAFGNFLIYSFINDNREIFRFTIYKNELKDIAIFSPEYLEFNVTY